jgi:hypothetical protein
MRLPRLRFTIRRMMVVVAILAVIIGGTQLWLRMRAAREREKAYRYMARYHAMHERAVVIAVRQGSATAGPDELARLNQEWSDYHATMKLKYERALANPGVAIPLDPPHPVLNKPGRSVDIHYRD